MSEDRNVSAQFGYCPNPPAITTLTPGAAEVGASVSVQVSGVNLSGATLLVDGVATQPFQADGSQMTFVLTSSAAGSKSVVVRAPNCPDSERLTFTFVPPVDRGGPPRCAQPPCSASGSSGPGAGSPGSGSPGSGPGSGGASGGTPTPVKTSGPIDSPTTPTPVHTAVPGP